MVPPITTSLRLEANGSTGGVARSMMSKLASLRSIITRASCTRVARFRSRISVAASRPLSSSYSFCLAVKRASFSRIPAKVPSRASTWASRTLISSISS